MEKCKIIVNDTQLRVIRDALNFYARSYIGQLDLNHVGFSYSEARMVETVFKHILSKGQLPTGASYSLCSKEISDNARVAADIQGVIRHFLWLQQPEDKRSDYTVDARAPSMWSEEQPIEIEKVINEKKRKPKIK